MFGSISGKRFPWRYTRSSFRPWWTDSRRRRSGSPWALFCRWLARLHGGQTGLV